MSLKDQKWRREASPNEECGLGGSSLGGRRGGDSQICPGRRRRILLVPGSHSPISLSPILGAVATADLGQRPTADLALWPESSPHDQQHTGPGLSHTLGLGDGDRGLPYDLWTQNFTLFQRLG